ncbi:MAG: DUF2207 domain-containing protein [Cyclobacteriaceae bacterium]|nr:DUF2207 domain-containing protein [Cyclobacteriaceae bacterium]
MKNIIILLLISICSFSIKAQERIIEFHSDITVNTDRSIDVVETIKVNAEGYRIQRGIYRDIPIVLLNENGTKRYFDLEVKSVLKNGEPEPFSEIGISNGRKIRIGDANVFLEHGEYEYTIAYNMNDQVRFFDEYDELYWNVTGNFWQFEIEKASTKITLPEGAVISQYNGFTGEEGDVGSDFEVDKLNDNILLMKTTKALPTYHGLTVGVGWQKGVIPPPTAEELRAIEMKKYKGAIYGVVGVFIIFLYLLWAWFKVGVDPKGGVIIPRFDPPKGYSPAACRFVLNMGFDNKSFAASLVSMAVKGFVQIDKTKKKYKLNKISKDEKLLSKGEQRIVSKLFSGGKTSIEIDQGNHSRIRGAISALEKLLNKDFMKLYFNKNYIWMIPAILMTIATSITMLVSVAYDEEIIFPMLFGMIVVLFITIFTYVNIKAVKKASGWQKIPVLIGLLIPIVIFIVAPINIIVQLDVITLDGVLVFVPYFIVYVVMISLISLFFHLIKAPTVTGRKVMDEVEGLKLFMEVAEKDRLNMLNQPDKTPQLFEKLLPYAIALGVENEWGKQFESLIAKAIENKTYHPTWYVGDVHMFSHVDRLSNNLGSSFSSSISSASISPQSSGSSSGGGGFSGGGGGGGGGGGW